MGRVRVRARVSARAGVRARARVRAGVRARVRRDHLGAPCTREAHRPVLRGERAAREVERESAPG